MPYVPPWLQPADPAGEYTRGLSIGVQVAGERARLQQESQRAQMETQARQAELQRQTQYEQARLATEQARVQAETGLRQQRLNQIAAENEQKTKAAAMKFADQRGYAQDLQGGMSHEQALYRHPLVMTPAGIADAQKEDAGLSAQHLQLARDRLSFQEEQALSKHAKSPSVTYRPSGGDFSETAPLDVMQGQFGTNLPPSMQAKQPSPLDYPLADAETAARVNPFRDRTPAPPFTEGQSIRNKKDNKIYKVINGVPVAQDDTQEQ